MEQFLNFGVVVALSAGLCHGETLSEKPNNTGGQAKLVTMDSFSNQIASARHLLLERGQSRDADDLTDLNVFFWAFVHPIDCAYRRAPTKAGGEEMRRTCIVWRALLKLSAEAIGVGRFSDHTENSLCVLSFMDRVLEDLPDKASDGDPLGRQGLLHGVLGGAHILVSAAVVERYADLGLALHEAGETLSKETIKRAVDLVRAVCTA